MKGKKKEATKQFHVFVLCSFYSDIVQIYRRAGGLNNVGSINIHEGNSLALQLKAHRFELWWKGTS